MKEKSLIFGVSDSLEDLIFELIKKNVDLDLDNDYYMNISPPPISESAEFFGNSVISGIFVDLNVDLLNNILSWIEAKKLKNPKLKILMEGNLVNLNEHDLGILLNIIKKCSEHRNF